MGIGVSIFLIAVGAILAFAVNAQLAGLDVQAVGWILMILGLIGLILTLILWSRHRADGTVGAPAYGTRLRRPRGRIVEREVAPPTERVVERDVYDDRYDDRPPLR